MKKAELIARIKAHKARSAWQRGVKAYAEMIVDTAYDDYSDSIDISKRALLRGADSWNTYSYGGAALIYDGDIAQTLCTPSELRRTKAGGKRPCRQETWLDVQARALYQAASLIIKISKCKEEEY